MNFAFSEEQEELRRTVRAFLDQKSPESEVRRLMDTEQGYDDAVWRQMGEQMGLQGLIVPEEYGGSGYSYVELIVVLEEMGRSLLCAPYFSTVALAANTLIHSADDQAKKELLPGIASGETIATLAFTEPSGKWDEAGITTPATKSGDSWTISGTKMFVLDGHTADLILVAARTSAGVSLFAVEGGASGLTRTALSTMDQTRKQAKVEFDNTPARLIGTDGAGWNVLSTVLDLAAVALAAEQVGGAQKCLDMAVEYAEGARAVRSPDRFVPGDQAQVRRHAARGRVGEVGRVLRRLVRGRDERGASLGRVAREGVLLRGVLPRGRREHPDPRRHRVHVGAPRAPVLQAGQVVRAAVR